MILLIQFRTDQSGWHEVKCIYDAAGIPFNEYMIVNAQYASISSGDILTLAEKSKAVIMGGLGEGGYEAKTKKDKQVLIKIRKKMIPVIEALAAEGKPMLGTCFGHQLMADALGGKVSNPKAQAEVGFTEVKLTPKGARDPLFKGVGEKFIAIAGHKSSVIRPPKNATLLASTDKSPYQSFRYGKNIYSTQFHVELEEDDLAFRLGLYPEYQDHSLDTAPQSLHTKQITKNFIKLISK